MARGNDERHNPRRKVGRGLKLGDTLFHKNSGDQYWFWGHGDGDDTRGYMFPVDKPGRGSYENLDDFDQQNPKGN